MTSERQKKVLRNVIEYFSKQNKSAQKILVQKAIYFLNFIGIDTGFRFEGYQYGPFSVDIMNVADEMEISQEIKIDRTTYVANEDLVRDYQELGDLDEKLRVYYEDLLKKDDSFDTVERVGTVMFVMENRESGDVKGIIDDVERWKPGKYSEKEIIATVQAIKAVRQKLK
jgi:uncharacterized protein YwgA